MLAALTGPVTLLGLGCSLGARDALLAGAYDFISSTTTTALQSVVDAATSGMASGTNVNAGNDAASAQDAP